MLLIYACTFSNDPCAYLLISRTLIPNVHKREEGDDYRLTLKMITFCIGYDSGLGFGLCYMVKHYCSFTYNRYITQSHH